MDPKSIEVLERNYGYWIMLRDGGYLKQLDYSTKAEIRDVALKEIGYAGGNLWCGACVAELLKAIQRHKQQLHPPDSGDRP